jgi:hypothetical protein
MDFDKLSSSEWPAQFELCLRTTPGGDQSDVEVGVDGKTRLGGVSVGWGFWVKCLLSRKVAKVSKRTIRPSLESRPFWRLSWWEPAS